MSVAPTQHGGVLVGLGGFEPPTSPLSGVRSNQLSYRPALARLFRVMQRCARRSVGHYLMVTPSFTSPAPRLTRKILRNRPCLQIPNTGPHHAARRQFRRFDLRSGNEVWVLAKPTASHVSVKEVIQPQVPLRLPCYDFTPVMNHTVVIVPPKVRLTTSGAIHSHGVTGGVYKARERIHRDILIRDY